MLKIAKHKWLQEFKCIDCRPNAHSTSNYPYVNVQPIAYMSSAVPWCEGNFVRFTSPYRDYLLHEYTYKRGPGMAIHTNPIKYSFLIFTWPTLVTLSQGLKAQSAF